MRSVIDFYFEIRTDDSQ